MTPKGYTILYLLLCTVYSIVPVAFLMIFHGITNEGFTISSEYSMIVAYSSIIPYALGILGGILYADNLRNHKEQEG